MNFFFHPSAKREMFKAIQFYRKIDDSLALNLSVEIDSSIARILDFPYAWSEISYGCRRCILNRYPYVFIYLIDPDGIYFLAFSHFNRDPDYWVDRI